jgi:lysophospholipase L1-like esterase
MPQLATSGRPKLLLLGDSLTQISFEGGGWASSLANRYQRRADVLNRGMSGYNSRWYIRYAEDNDVWNESGNIVLITIFFGANDAALPDRDPAKHVPIPEYQENLEIIIDNATKSYPNAKILLISPPPVHRGQRLAFQKVSRRFKNYTRNIWQETENEPSQSNTLISSFFSFGLNYIVLYCIVLY